MTSQVRAEEWDSGAEETYNDGVRWWAECDECNWAGSDRGSKSWAARDRHNHEWRAHRRLVTA